MEEHIHGDWISPNDLTLVFPLSEAIVASPVGGEDDPDPVEGIGRVRRHNPEQGNLGDTKDDMLTEQEDGDVGGDD